MTTTNTNNTIAIPDGVELQTLVQVYKVTNRFAQDVSHDFEGLRQFILELFFSSFESDSLQGLSPNDRACMAQQMRSMLYLIDSLNDINLHANNLKV